MDNLLGKRILLISLRGYSDGIKKKMEDMGAVVDHINDKPNDGFICKTCGRFAIKPYLKVIDKYYEKCIKRLKDNKYDYILAIRGEYTTEKALNMLKNAFPDAKLILYMWDSLRNNKHVSKKWHWYDKVFTFDRKDYLENISKLHFLPLFYYEDISSKIKNENSNEYDIAFIGTGHEDRVKIVNKITEECRREGLRMYSYVFLPHKLVYFYNKIFNKHYKGINDKKIHYEMLPLTDAYRMYGKSKCVMDIESSTQTGLTMRTIEMIGLRKKLVTTNKDIVNYDFYNENNIMVVDRKKFEIDNEFFNKPYINLDEEIYEKYSLRNWIINVLS